MPYIYTNSYRCPYCNSYAQTINSPSPQVALADYGPYPFVINIDEAAEQNRNFRTVLWTGNHMQLTLMSIPVGGEIGLEVHPDVDQLISIKDGEGLVLMGEDQGNLNYRQRVGEDYVIIIPAGTWHNLINVGNEPIKLYSVYAPPQHPHGTVHGSMEDEARQEQGMQ